MQPNIVETVWQLRTDPFYPAVDSQGGAIDGKACQFDLNPLLDERVLPIYFDVYDWTKSALVGGISQHQTLDTFPNPRTLPRNAAMMILVSGAMATGLDSFANLVMHKVSRSIEQALWVIDLELDGRDKVRNVALLASTMIRKLDYADVRPPDADKLIERMEKVFTKVNAAESGRADATYSEVFQAFADLLKPLSRQIVIKIAGNGNSDSWERIYDSVKHCCSFLLVMTSDELYAQACNNAMTANGANFAWVRALPLDQQRAGQYLMSRLRSERMTGMASNVVAPTFPFTPEAIAALYEPGLGSVPGKAVLHPVGWLRRTLGTAFDDQAKALAKRHGGATAQDIAAIDPASTTIGAAEVTRAWHRHNRR